MSESIYAWAVREHARRCLIEQLKQDGVWDFIRFAWPVFMANYGHKLQESEAQESAPKAIHVGEVPGYQDLLNYLSTNVKPWEVSPERMFEHIEPENILILALDVLKCREEMLKND